MCCHSLFIYENLFFYVCVCVCMKRKYFPNPYHFWHSLSYVHFTLSFILIHTPVFTFAFVRILTNTHTDIYLYSFALTYLNKQVTVNHIKSHKDIYKDYKAAVLFMLLVILSNTTSWTSQIQNCSSAVTVM